jgi:hypothetical protein
MEPASPPDWSDDIGQAGWIGERLTEFAKSITAIVPGGFEAYTRILHPAEMPRNGYGRLVRWHEVAAWSGMPLRPNAQFHSIAMPPLTPKAQPPWDGQGPGNGSLYSVDAEVLAALLRQRTTTPDDCWFCVWDGYGWESRQQTSPTGGPPRILPDPIPSGVRNGPRVRLPHRDYLLFRGPVESVGALTALDLPGQTPNLWWPQDHSWCVASEIDLPWTYVGGKAEVVAELVNDGRLEAVPADASDPPSRFEDWFLAMVNSAVEELIQAGETTISTSRGSIVASLDRPRRFHSGALRAQMRDVNGAPRGGGMTALGSRDEDDMRASISFQLLMKMESLAGG